MPPKCFQKKINSQQKPRRTDQQIFSRSHSPHVHFQHWVLWWKIKWLVGRKLQSTIKIIYNFLMVFLWCFLQHVRRLIYLLSTDATITTITSQGTFSTATLHILLCHSFFHSICWELPLLRMTLEAQGILPELSKPDSLLAGEEITDAIC